MGITVAWHETCDRIQIWTFDYQWTWAEFNQLLHINSKPGSKYREGRVDVIADIEKTIKLPSNSMHNLHRISAAIPDNVGVLVVCTSASSIHTFINVAKKMYPKAAERYHAAFNRETALYMIKAHRQKCQ